MYKYLLIIIFLFSSYIYADDNYIIDSCNDGDTCKIKANNNIVIKIRLAGIDAPEFGGSKKQGQKYSAEAKDYLNNSLQGKKVQLKSYGIDGYGRNLAEIFLNNENINLKLLANGYAEMYKGKSPKDLNTQLYVETETEAKKNKIGIWKLEDYESPSVFRKKSKK